MNNIKLIIGREYWTRVKSKMFLLTTFLAPIGVALLYAVLFFFLLQGSDKERIISIIDEGDIAVNIVEKSDNLILQLSDQSLEELKQQYINEEIDAILQLPAIDSTTQRYEIIVYADKPLAIDEQMKLESIFAKELRDFKIKAFGINQEQLKQIETDISLLPRPIVDKEKTMSSLTSTVTSGVGMLIGGLLFFVIMIFGTQVMKGVNEEKVNRIVEVLISSVKPFDLMTGKVIGIGLVGITQMVIWGILIGILFFVGNSFFDVQPEAMNSMSAGMNAQTEAMMADPSIQDKIKNVMFELLAINWALLIPLYIFYFLAGYLVYASLFAAVGAAAGDDVNEAQSLSTVVVMPLIAAFYIGLSAMRAPDSTLAVWSSIIPLTSPIVMPVRLATEPPAWQIIASIVAAIVFTTFMIWLASRIYRVGILLYGKKASFKELGKWVFSNQ